MTGPKYDANLIKPISGPEVEGDYGDFRSTWVLTLRGSVPRDRLEALARTLSRIDGIHAADLEAVDDVAVRVVLRTEAHPFDVEGFLWSGAFLVESDEALGGLAEINGNPRDWWRPFRPAPLRRD